MRTKSATVANGWIALGHRVTATVTDDGVWFIRTDVCDECGKPEPGCDCPCVNCGATLKAHHDGRPLTAGTDCPQN